MPYNPIYNLQGKPMANTYAQLVESDGSGSFYDGRGNQIYLTASVGVSSSYATTASYATNVGSGGTTLVTASTYQITSSCAVSASWAPSSGGGSSVSASWASQSLSASWALNAGFITPIFYDSDNNSYYGLSIKGTTGNEVIQIDSVTYNSQSGIFSNESSSYSPVQLPDITDIVTSHNIGINQPNPQYTLDVTYNGGNHNVFRADNGDGSSITINDNDTIIIYGGNGDISLITEPGHNVLLQPPNLYSNGNVGIGTNSPNYTLDVNGDINFNGAIHANSNSKLLDGQGLWNPANANLAVNIQDEQWLNDVLGVGLINFTGNGNPVEIYSNLKVYGDIDFVGNLLKSGSVYVPNNAVSASYVVTAQTASYVTASNVIATKLLQMPYSSSADSLTPTLNTGSFYLKISGSTTFLYAYNGTNWKSSSMS